MLKSTIRLFKALPIVKDDGMPFKNPSKELLEKTVRRGFVFSPEIVSHYQDYDKLIRFIEEDVGLTPEKLNNTFHKSWQKVQDASMTQLVMEQLIHYLTTYGFEDMDIYHEDSVYIPNERLDIPNLDIDALKLVVIKGYTKEELKEKLMKMLSSGIALKETTIVDVVELGGFVGLDEHDFEKIKNKEVKITLYDELKIVPQNPIEFLRYVLFKITDNTLLIKNPAMIEKIKEKMKGSSIGDQVTKNNILKMFEGFGTTKTSPRRIVLNGYQLRRLSEVFYRFKPLFLALREDHRIRPYINKIRKLAKVYHKPMPEDYLNTVTARIKRPSNKIDASKLNDELGKVNTFRKIRLAYALKFRTKNPESILYKIRNGKGFATKFDFDNTQEAEEIANLVLYGLQNSIVNDIKANVKEKKVYIPDYISYTLPTTEKQFVGDFPSGTYISVPENMLVGVHWENTINRVDLDLSFISHKYGKVGWDSLYRTEDANILFSGDITDAPKNKGGATELFYVKRQIDQSSIVLLNYFNWGDNSNDGEVSFKIIVASENAKNFGNNYVVNPNNVIAQAEATIAKGQKILGLLVTTNQGSKFYFTEANIGLSITSSRDTSYIADARNYLFDFNTNMITLNEVLEKAGARIINEQGECDIDLSPENLERDSILRLING